MPILPPATQIKTVVVNLRAVIDALDRNFTVRQTKGWKWFKGKIRPVAQAPKDKMHELAEKIKEAANRLKVTVSEFLARILFLAFYHNQAIDIHLSFGVSEMAI